MSKIYEALLRAELERAQAQKGSTNGAHPSVLQALEAEPAPRASVAVLPKPGPQPPSPSTSAFMLSDELPGDSRFTPVSIPAEAAAHPFDESHITPRIWNPSLHQLPSLEERGSGVEQFRSLRSRMHEFRDLDSLKSILVSSGVPQEGKSFVSTNLAISFARHKASRVLLIDGDMRRSTLHHLLGAPLEPGLAEYLAGKATLLDVMQRGQLDPSSGAIFSGLASLTFISGGNGGDKVADLSGNHRFDELIAAAKPHFDWIIVDSTPVNLVADGVNLARACDGVLLVARGGLTKFQTLQRAMGELKASKMLGVVLNAVEKPPVTGGYYGYDSVKE